MGKKKQPKRHQPKHPAKSLTEAAVVGRENTKNEEANKTEKENNSSMCFVNNAVKEFCEFVIGGVN